MPLTVNVVEPDASLRADVLALADAVAAADGAPPLSDQTLTHLRAGSGGVTHLVATGGGRLRGYAQLDGTSAEIAAASAHATRLLLDALERESAEPVLVWSHGRRSRIGPVLSAIGFDAVRELHQMRRRLGADAELPDAPELADGVRIRAFRPGQDDAAWLEVNAAAFATHPEQGRWTQADLDARMAESWFDADGFLVAERDGRMLGYHWTKIHPDGDGEVYVLGVAPRAQGMGLGRVLLVCGLRHLADRGCPRVLLYVDGDNTGAMRMYERDGFRRFDLDIQWRSPSRL